MSKLDIWDGPNLINNITSLHTSGDHRVDPVPGVNAFHVLDAGTGAIHKMNFGLNLSMEITFRIEDLIIPPVSSSITFKLSWRLLHNE